MKPSIYADQEAGLSRLRFQFGGDEFEAVWDHDGMRVRAKEPDGGPGRMVLELQWYEWDLAQACFAAVAKATKRWQGHLISDLCRN